jgi:nicotinamide-nucleotide amidase
MDEQLEQLARQVGTALQRRGWLLATAESCTGGWVAAALTAIAGSSEWFERGFVTYSNAAKQEMLGVRADTLARHGAVSEMAEGALARSGAQVSLAISGIAGPGGASPGKPVGTVWHAWAARGLATRVDCALYPGDREAVRRQAVVQALRGLGALVGTPP